MLKAKRIFDEGINRVKSIDSLFIHLSTRFGFNSTDISDILRSELVYSLSSFDRLMHDLIKAGMIETFKGQRVSTNAYKNFNISLNQFESINSATVPPAEHIFEMAILLNHKHATFQEPAKVVDGLSLIWNENHKWQNIATLMGRSQDDVRTELKNIVIRRNQIVHEGDFDLFTGSLLAIHHSDVIESVNFINDLGNSIYSLVR